MTPAHAIAGAALALFATGALAQALTYPNRPLRLIVPFAPGGTNDIVARLVGQKLAERWGHTVVIDNRAGGGGLIGTEMAARATPDGHTLLMANVNFAVNPSMLAKLPYDTARDFAMVALIAHSASVLVAHPSFPARTVGDLLDAARAKPGAINYASPSPGATGHLAMELLLLLSKTRLAPIHYKGGGPQLIDLLAGRVPVGFTTMLPTLPHVESGRLRALAVSGGKRAAALPAVPTVAEAGVPGYEFTGWWGIATAARTPAAVLAQANRALAEIAALPEFRATLEKQGAEAAGGSLAEVASFVRAETAKWAKVVQAAGIRAD